MYYLLVSSLLFLSTNNARRKQNYRSKQQLQRKYGIYTHSHIEKRNLISNLPTQSADTCTLPLAICSIYYYRSLNPPVSVLVTTYTLGERKAHAPTPTLLNPLSDPRLSARP